MIKVAILTVSDSCAQGTREDLSSPAIRELLQTECCGLEGRGPTRSGASRRGDEGCHGQGPQTRLAVNPERSGAAGILPAIRGRDALDTTRPRWPRHEHSRTSLTVAPGAAGGSRDELRPSPPPLSFEVCEERIVADDRSAIARELVRFSDECGYDLVFTTGGTGLGPRDVTPEATASVCERLVPGFGELMRAEGRKKTPNAMLSRGIAGLRGRTLIVNLPGSPRAVRECLEAIGGILPHAFEMIRGGGHESKCDC